jgi:hypothetical protein
MSREKIQSGWEKLIFSAREMLKRVEAKAQRLRTDIEIMEESRDSGEPCPVVKDAGTEESIPA